MTLGQFWERHWRPLITGATLVVVFVWGMAAGRAFSAIPPTPAPFPTSTPTPTPTAAPSPIPTRVPDVTLTFSGPIVGSETGEAVVADVHVDGKLVQQAVTEVDLVILLHVDRRTELRVEAPGYEPWALLIRGGGENQRMEGPILLVPIPPTATPGPNA